MSQPTGEEDAKPDVARKRDLHRDAEIAGEVEDTEPVELRLQKQPPVN